MLNVAPPLLALYSRSIDETKYMDLALDTLEQLKGENNAITRKYVALGEQIRSAFESQGYVQLHNAYCTERKCLNCKIGVSIMNRGMGSSNGDVYVNINSSDNIIFELDYFDYLCKK